MRLFHSLCSTLVVGLVAAQAGERYGAVPIAPNDLMPRFFLDKSNPIAKRDASCGDSQHSCLDVGFGDSCCDNDSYCYINGTGTLKCCPIGSNCVGDSVCSSSAYYCTRTVTASGTPSPQTGCCGRKCPGTSLFLCPSSLGGNCCSYDAECRANGACAATKTTSQSALLTPVVPGCTTSQYKCADGSGCCDNSQHCTRVSGTGYCASGNPAESASVIPDPGDGLSTGAKAGIGVGAVVGSSIIIGGLTWLCISKRRNRQRTLSRHSGVEGSRTGGQDSAPPVDGMTDVSGTEYSRVRHGLTQDYFGPDAVAGPFTEVTSTTTSPGQSRAVPTQPHGPGDITAAVEIDSTAKDDHGNGYLSPNSNSSVAPTPQSETIEGRFELYGSANPPLSIVPTPQESPVIRSAQPTE